MLVLKFFVGLGFFFLLFLLFAQLLLPHSYDHLAIEIVLGGQQVQVIHCLLVFLVDFVEVGCFHFSALFI